MLRPPWDPTLAPVMFLEISRYSLEAEKPVICEPDCCWPEKARVAGNAAEIEGWYLPKEY